MHLVTSKVCAAQTDYQRSISRNLRVLQEMNAAGELRGLTTVWSTNGGGVEVARSGCHLDDPQHATGALFKACVALSALA